MAACQANFTYYTDNGNDAESPNKMTPKQQYDAAQAAKRRARMTEDEAYEAHKRRDQLADEATVVVLEGVKAFFEGRATLQISPPSASALGNPPTSVRFIMDDQREVTK